MVEDFEAVCQSMQHIQWQKCLMATAVDSVWLCCWPFHGLQRAGDYFLRHEPWPALVSVVSSSLMI
jgi:hypothetical protein